MKEYKTVEFESKDEFIEKKSRFIGYVKPVKTQEEATEFINSIKSKHWDATHNVSAYVLRDNNIQRSSDDGEPSGTAGVPTLDVLLKEGIVDTCVVVTTTSSSSAFITEQIFPIFISARHNAYPQPSVSPSGFA